MKQPYILRALMHSGKTVVKLCTTHSELKDEVRREQELRAFYAQASWRTRDGKLKTVAFV